MTPTIPFIVGTRFPIFGIGFRAVIGGGAPGYRIGYQWPSIPIPTDDLAVIANKNYIIDEIRITTATWAGGTTFNDALAGDQPWWQAADGNGAFALELSIGPWNLTRGYVPLGCLAPVAPIAGAQGTGTFGKLFGDDRWQGTTGWLNSVTSPFPELMVHSYKTWRFPEPLIVPASMSLRGSIRADADYGPRVLRGSAGTLTPSNQTDPAQWGNFIDFSIVGRILPDDYVMPKKIKVPWVSAFRGNPSGVRQTSLNPATVAVYGDQPSISNEEFKNPFTSPLHIQRIIGRMHARRADDVDVGGGVPCPFDRPVGSADGERLDEIVHSTNMLVDAMPFFFDDGSNRVILIEYDGAGGKHLMMPRAPMNQMFGHDQVWNIGQALKPLERLVLTIDPAHSTGDFTDVTTLLPLYYMSAMRKTSIGGGASGHATIEAFPVFAINGWREETLS